MSTTKQFSYDSKYFEGKMSNWTEMSFATISHRLAATLQNQGYSKRGVAVDYGCGAGVYYDALRATGLKVVGVDVSPSALESARQQSYDQLLLLKDDNVPLPDKAVSVLFTTEVMEHIEHVDRAVAEFSRIIDAGGVLILTTTLYFPSINTYLSTAIIKKHSPGLILSQICRYFAGFFSKRSQEAFVRQWCFLPLGGHFHGFHIRQLKSLLVASGFEISELVPLRIFKPIGFTKWMDPNYLKSAPVGKKLLWTLPMLALRVLNFILKAFTFTANNIYIVAKKGGAI